MKLNSKLLLMTVFFSLFTGGLCTSLAQDIASEKELSLWEDNDAEVREVKKIFQTKEIFFNLKTNREDWKKIFFTFSYDTLFRKSPNSFAWTVKGLPKGAKFDEEQRQISWKPKMNQTGEYRTRFIVQHQDVIDTVYVNFVVTEEWQSYFIPGVSYSFYQPDNKAKYGLFQGASVEYLIAAWIHKNENRGPSHGRVYLKFDMVSTDKADMTDGFLYSFGLNMSLERNPVRSYLIPFFGLELGGMYQKTMGKTFNITPVAGIWAYSSQNLFINIYGGYLLPTDNYEDIRGLRLNAGVNFSLW